MSISNTRHLKRRPVEELSSPTLDRLRQRHDPNRLTRIDLSDAEVARLAEVLDRGFSPTPALRKALSRLADPKRKPPRLRNRLRKLGQAGQTRA